MGVPLISIELDTFTKFLLITGPSYKAFQNHDSLAISARVAKKDPYPMELL